MTDQITEARRAKFYAWCETRGITKISLELFECWCAALDSIVIDLKSPAMDYSYRDSEIIGACKHYDRVRESIHAAGVRTR